MTVVGIRTERRIRRRIEDIVGSRPGDRRERLWARSVADLERVAAQAVEDFGEPVGPDERRAVQRHLAEVMAMYGPAAR